MRTCNQFRMFCGKSADQVCTVTSQQTTLLEGSSHENKRAKGKKHNYFFFRRELLFQFIKLFLIGNKIWCIKRGLYSIQQRKKKMQIFRWDCIVIEERDGQDKDHLLLYVTHHCHANIHQQFGISSVN